MRRRLATVIVPALLLLVTAPATTAAQAPPDERAAAQAFADAALRAQSAVEDLNPHVEDLFEKGFGRCATRQLARMPERRGEMAGLLLLAPVFQEFARLLEPSLTQASLDLHSVQTADPALRAGRTAFRRARRLFADITSLRSYKACPALREWIRGGYRPTPSVRVARRVSRLLERSIERSMMRRLNRAGRRMRELGVSKAGVEAFAGEGAASAAIARW